MMDERPVSRGSKQKIMKLKEELNEKSNADPQKIRIHQLKESYDLAVLKMNEMNNAQTSNLYVKVHGKRAGRAYSALSSIIYASIASAKIEGLEVFIRQTVASLPANMIDLEEWNHILNLARDCREVALSQTSGNQLTNNAGNNKPPDYLKKFQLLYFLATNPVRNVKDELIVFRKQIIHELTVFHQYFVQTLLTIATAMKKIRDLSSNDLNLKKIVGLRHEIGDLNRTIKQTQEQGEANLRQQKEEFQQVLRDNTKQLVDERNQLADRYQQALDDLQAQLEEKTRQRDELEESFTQLTAKHKQTTKEKDHLHESLVITTTEYESLQNDYNNLKKDSGKQMVNYLTFQMTNQIIEESIHKIESMSNEKRKSDYQHEIDQLKKVQQELKDELNEKQQKIHHQEEIIAQQQQKHQDFEDEIAALNASSAKLSSDQAGVIKNLQAELTKERELLEEEKRRVEEEKQRVQEEKQLVQEERDKNEHLKNLLSQKNDDYERLNNTLNDEKEKSEKIQNSLNELSFKSEEAIVGILSNLEKEKEQSLNLVNTIESLEKQLKDQEDMLQQSEQHLSSFQKLQEEKYHNLLNEKQSEIESLQAKLQTIHTSVTTAAAVIASAPATPSGFEAQTDLIHSLVQEKAELEFENEKLQDQLRSMKEMIAKYESEHEHDNALIHQLQDEVKHFQALSLQPLQQDLLDKIESRIKELTNLEQQIREKIQSMNGAPADIPAEIAGTARRLITSLENLDQEVQKNNDFSASLFTTNLQYSKNTFFTLTDEAGQLEEQYQAWLKSSQPVVTETSRPMTPEVSAKLRALEKELAVLKDKHEIVCSLKNDQDIVIKDLREEINRMTNQLIELKEQNKEINRRAVGFNDSPEVYLLKAASSQLSLTLNGSGEEGDDLSQGLVNPNPADTPITPDSSNPADGSTSPSTDEKIAAQLSPHSSISLDSTARNSAYYEAQRVVLDAIKTGLLSFQGNKVLSVTSSLKNSPRLSPRDPMNSGKVARSSFTSSAKGVVVQVVEEKTEEKTNDSPNVNTEEVQKEPDIAKEEEQKDAEGESSKKSRKPYVNPYSHLDMEDPKTKGAVKIQSSIRSFCARARVRRLHVERKAASQGILVACFGTVQGETGWYTTQDQLFYFCAQQDEFMLLCGPITHDIYELALEDLLVYLTPSIMTPAEVNNTLLSSPLGFEGSLEHRGSFSSVNSGLSMSALLEKYRKRPPKFPKSINIDQLGLQATRIQIETLLHDISLRDHYINEYENQLQQCQTTIQQLQDELLLKQYETEKLHLQYQDSEKHVKTLEKHVSFLTEQFNEKMKSSIDGVQQKMSDLLQQTDVYEKVYKKRFILLSSIIRGFLSRQRVKRIRQYRQAEETGVLLAMKNTIQGETGWYIGPNGSIFYFVLKDVSYSSNCYP